MRKTERKTKIPGIYKRFVFDDKTGDWKENGQYRAIRTVVDSEGESRIEKKVFDTLKEAKDFKFNAVQENTSVEVDELTKDEVEGSKVSYTFGDLIVDWRDFNYSHMEATSKETYNKHIKFCDNLKFKTKAEKDSTDLSECNFNDFEVESFNVEKIDDLVKTIMGSDFPKALNRISFKKELKFMEQLFKFYQKRKSPTFPIPVLNQHKRKSVIKKRDMNSNKEKYLRAEDLPVFFKGLKKHLNRNYYFLALSQYFLGLRIGEACGLHWEGFDEENLEWKIEKVIMWAESQSGVIKDLPKNDTIRYQPFSDFYLEEMRFFRMLTGESKGLVFNRSGKPMRRNSIVNAYNSVLRQCGITYTSGTHMMRKTSATLGHSVTKDTLGVSGFLGHSNVKITDAYLGRADNKRKHAEALDTVLNDSGFGETSSAALKLVR